MRPKILFPLFAPVTTLPGLGPRLGKLVERLAGPHVVDLLWHVPSGIIDRRFAPRIAEAPEGRIATITLVVDAHQPPRNPRSPYKVRCRDATGFLDLVFFHPRLDYLLKALPPGETRVVSGRVEHFGGVAQITHPDYIATPDEAAGLQTVEPIYPLTTGLTPRPLARAIREAVARAPELPEWADRAWIEKNAWPRWRAAVRAVHGPTAEADIAPDTAARNRLAYDELLANQLALALVRASHRRLPGRPIRGDGARRRRAVETLPFTLTGSQRQALAEIVSDMEAPSRMLRLLQGDVGSGKTVVAFLAMLNAVECGAQAALLAPTEILARQHHATIEALAGRIGIATALLTGRERGRPREAILDGLRSGALPIVVGTHAILQEEVAFRDLAFAVVDEQHRFGVQQRVALGAKGRAVDVLVMSATPIPRTLMMTAYGDLDLSRLTEKPAGRRPIDTRTVPLSRLDEVVAGLVRAIADGARVYWVCPLVEESEAADLAAATERYALLQTTFGDRVGLVHGRLKGTEKDAVMHRFAAGAIDILVATTVIEVGVDVPEATIMVIEHADRFGLAQLHQLRGRIGRSDRPSTCILLYGGPLGETARARLSTIRETDDGFRIAEEDLRLRGAGEVLGTRQSGLPVFRLVDLAAHAELLAVAQDDARLALERDPDLASDRGQALRILLYLFARDAVAQTLRAG
ncbi:MAG: ATP-dependent DNA helicase RecG [Alphaproteobacteria bacterium]|nr:ATP-dependent DNA helicase RecG [Alphaproteobacteria bacterium]